MAKRVHVIVNPAAGKDEKILNTLNSVFHPAGIEWDISVTLKAGDAQNQARQAAEDGVDVVAAYGGDGTMTEVASGLLGLSVPLAILPGGTANVLAVELGIPKKLADASALFTTSEFKTRPVDVGRLGDDRHFIQRVGVGLDAQMIKDADRELKDKFGNIAYLLGGIAALKNPPKATYRLTIDGQTFEEDGVFCLVSNTGNIGFTGVQMFKEMSVSDGLMDVVVFQQNQFEMIHSALRTALKGRKRRVKSALENIKVLQHRQARQITIETDPPQLTHIDGDLSGQTPVNIEVLPGAVQIIVPSE